MTKQAGEGKDFVVKTLNTLFNPFEYDNIHKPTDPSPGRVALHHAGGLAVGYGGLGLVARKLFRYQQTQLEKTQRDKLQSFVQAQYPTISIDPNTDDAEEEEEIKQLGLAPKEASSAAWQLAAGPKRTAVKTITGGQDSAHLALAVAAAIAGGTGGWQLAEYVRDRQRKQELTDRVTQSENEVDQLLHSEYRRTRGLDKQAFTPAELADKYPESAHYRGQVGAKEPSLIGALARPRGAVQAAENLWWLWAAAAFALSYRASKVYSDNNDPNRQRMKQLEEVAQDRAKVRTAPVLMNESNLAGMTHAKPRPKPKPTTSVTVAPTPPASTAFADATPVDASDPYADLLRM